MEATSQSGEPPDAVQPCTLRGEPSVLEGRSSERTGASLRPPRAERAAHPHKGFAEVIEAMSVADSPERIAPGVLFHELFVAGCGEPCGEVGVLAELCGEDFIHDSEPHGEPAGAKGECPAKAFRFAWGRDLCDLPAQIQVKGLGGGIGMFGGRVQDPLIPYRRREEVTEEEILIAEFHNASFPKAGVWGLQPPVFFLSHSTAALRMSP